MRREFIGSLAWLVIARAVLAAGSGPGGATSVDGVIRFDPPQSFSCIAVRVEVPADKMVTGLKWYNGTSTGAFPRILVASGNDFQPPTYDQAVVIAEDVQGLEQAWSEVSFTDPIASQSGTLFILVEYPAHYSPVSGQGVLGVGYANEATVRHYFVMGEALEWIKVISRCRVLLEPILVDRLPGVISLRGPNDATGEATVERLGLFSAPNPFNPEAKIDLYLPAATTGSVRIMDVRGCQVAELHHGALAKGQNSFVWKGRDGSGRAAASGVYWVLAQTRDQKLVRKLLLVK